MLFLLASLMLAQADGDATARPQPKHQTPVYLPRYGTLQTFFSRGQVAPALRLGWEADLIAQPRNTLVFNLELGVSYTSVAQNSVGTYWQYVGLLGLGYRMQRDGGFYWGFTVGAGPAVYGYKREQQVSVYVEGRINLGWRFGPVTVSLCGGYAQWLAYLSRSIAQLYLGGPFVGVMLGWK